MNETDENANGPCVSASLFDIIEPKPQSCTCVASKVVHQTSIFEISISVEEQIYAICKGFSEGAQRFYRKSSKDAQQAPKRV